MDTHAENEICEPDAIDKYLDIVTGRLDASLTNVDIAKRLNSTYGVEVSLDAAERVRKAAELEFQTGSEIARRLLAETRLEMEGHLRKHVAHLTLDGMSEDQAIVQALKRFGDPNKLREKVFLSALKECAKAPRYKFSWRSFFQPDTLLYFLSFSSAVFFGNIVAGNQLSNSVVTNLWGVVPLVSGIGAAIAEASRSPMRPYMQAVANAIDGKLCDPTASQKRMHFMTMLSVQPSSLPWALPLLVAGSLVIVVMGCVPLNFIARQAFGLGCHLIGLCWGRYIWSANFRKQVVN